MQLPLFIYNLDRGNNLVRSYLYEESICFHQLELDAKLALLLSPKVFNSPKLCVIVFVFISAKR
jgi:hypothetical protein